MIPAILARLTADGSDFDTTLTGAERRLDSFESGVEARSSRIGQAVGRGMVVAGGAAVAAGAVLTKLADEGHQATAQLRTSIENAGGSYDELAPRIGKVSDRLIKLGIDDEATARSLATLTTATQDPAKALDSMGLAADIAAARHISLESASDKLAKAYTGNTRVFKEFGIELAANATEAERSAAMSELMSRVQGQAAAQADTFGNKLEVAKIKLENIGEAIGSKVGPALTIAGPLVAGFGGILESGLIGKIGPAIASMGTFAASMISTGASAAAAAIPVIVAWAPVILTIAAIGAAAYLLYKNWDEVWGLITGITSAAWDWIKSHLDLIAAVVLAPVAPLILLVTHWDEAWTFVKDITGAAWDWLRSTIGSGVETVVGFVASLPGRAADALSSLGGRVVDVAAGAMRWLWETVSGGVSDVVGVAAELPGRIADAVGDLGSLLWGAGQDIVRGLVRGIASMGGWLWDQVTSFISRNIPGPVKRVLGIGSPSKLFAGYGVNLAEGLVIGLDRGHRVVESAAAALAGAAAVGVPSPSFGSSVTGGGSSSAGSPLAGSGRGGTVIHLSPTIEVYTATGDIPAETIRKIRAALEGLAFDMPAGSILPA